MITKLESNVIKAFIAKNTDNKPHYVAADNSSIKISKSVNILLEFFSEDYNRINKTRMGKSSYLHIILKKLKINQPAIFALENCNSGSYDKSVMNALQQAKKIFRQYVDDNITTLNDCIFALLLYTIIREYEEKAGFRLTDFRDDEYESEHKKEGLLQSTAPIPLAIPEPPSPIKPRSPPPRAQQVLVKPDAIAASMQKTEQISKPLPRPVSGKFKVVVIPQPITASPLLETEDEPLDDFEGGVSPVQHIGTDHDLSDLFEDDELLDEQNAEPEDN